MKTNMLGERLYSQSGLTDTIDILSYSNFNLVSKYLRRSVVDSKILPEKIILSFGNFDSLQEIGDCFYEN